MPEYVLRKYIVARRLLLASSIFLIVSGGAGWLSNTGEIFSGIFGIGIVLGTWVALLYAADYDYGLSDS